MSPAWHFLNAPFGLWAQGENGMDDGRGRFRRCAEMPRLSDDEALSYVGEALSYVGEALSYVGDALSYVGEAFWCDGGALFVGDGFGIFRVPQNNVSGDRRRGRNRASLAAGNSSGLHRRAIAPPYGSEPLLSRYRSHSCVARARGRTIETPGAEHPGHPSLSLHFPYFQTERFYMPDADAILTAVLETVAY